MGLMAPPLRNKHLEKLHRVLCFSACLPLLMERATDSPDPFPMAAVK